MSLSKRYISIYEVIERVFMDNDYEDVPIQDAVEWAGRAMDRIGVPMAFEEANPEIIKVEHGRGKFPCDMIKVIQMRTWPNLGPLVMSTNNFALPNHNGSEEDNDRSHALDISAGYKVHGDYFYPPFIEGEVQLAYLRFPTDDNGFPMIPKETKYSDAVAAYIQMKLDWREFRKGKVSGSVYQLSKKNWAYSAGQAKSKSLIYENVDEWQSFFNMFTRLIPNVNFHSTGFANASVKEKRRNNPSGLSRYGTVR